MSGILQDLKFSLRMLVKSPLFTGIAIVTLMLGIGLNAATFSTVNTLLFEGLSGVEKPDRLVQLYRHWAGIEYGSNSIPHYQDLRDRTGDVFDSVASWNIAPMSITADGRNERIMGILASANFFQTYGAEPAMGRPFLPGVEDQAPGGHAVTVLSHGFWQDKFGGRQDIVGDTMEINGLNYEIVGIAPEDFHGPMLGMQIPLYVPMMMHAQIMPGSGALEQRGSNSYSVVARMKDEVSLTQVQDAVDAVLVGLGEEYPDQYQNQLGTNIVLQSEAGIHPTMRQAQAGLSAVIMVVVGLLLLIACVNVANLFLARARDRQREMSVRLSLGASRWRVLRQLIVESMVFSLLAGIASCGLAFFAVRMLSRFEPPVDAPIGFDFAIDLKVLAYTLVLSLGAGFLFGLVPALRSARSELVSSMRVASSVQRSRASKALVVLQMAMSLVLLISSGLFIRSMQGAMQIDPGFAEPNHLVLASVDPGLQGYTEEQAHAFYDRLTEKLEASGEYKSVGLTNTVPLGLSGSDRGVEIPGYEFAEGERQSLQYAMVREGYFETMGIELSEGRTFTRADTGETEPVVIVNQRFAERFWPNESALGRVVTTAGEDRRVVGVVENGKYRSLGEAPSEFMFFPHRERFDFAMTVVARTERDPEDTMASLRAAVTSLDDDMPVYDIRTMEDHMGMVLLPARVGASVLGLFGVLGLLLAAVGIYGVMAYSVAQRKRELGIRVALGANRPTVLRQVLGEGLALAVVGAVLGLIGAALAARAVSGLLYNTSALDPITFVAVPLLLLGVAAASVYVPAQRAAKSDPMHVLRME